MLIRPTHLTEAIQCIATLNPKTSLVFAGGTDAIANLKQDLFDPKPEVMVSLALVKELSSVECIPNTSRIKIGALTKLSAFTKNKIIKDQAAVLSETARLIASPQIRNQATVGGNLLVNNRCAFYNQPSLLRESHDFCFKADGNACHLFPNRTLASSPVCHARFVSDLAPVFLVLGAQVVIESLSAGTRTAALDSLYPSDGLPRHRLKQGELLTWIEVDTKLAGHVAYEKLRIRQGLDFPSLGVALLCHENTLRVSVTGVHFRPLVMEKILAAKISEGDVIALADEVTRNVVASKQDFFPPRYRREMIAVLMKRCFQKISSKN